MRNVFQNIIRPQLFKLRPGCFPGQAGQSCGKITAHFPGRNQIGHRIAHNQNLFSVFKRQRMVQTIADVCLPPQVSPDIGKWLGLSERGAMGLCFFRFHHITCRGNMVLIQQGKPAERAKRNFRFQK